MHKPERHPEEFVRSETLGPAGRSPSVFVKNTLKLFNL